MILQKDFVGRILASAVVTLVVLVGIMSATFAQANTGYGGDDVHCTMYANPEVTTDGSATLIWWSSENVVSAELEGAGTVDAKGWWWMNSITETSEYTLTVMDVDGVTSTCSATVTVEGDVEGEIGDAPTCSLVADPNPVVDGSTTLTWTSENGVSASLHPTGSTSYFADVSANGSWYIGGIEDDRSYSVTILGEDDQSVTCDVALTVETVEEEETHGYCKDVYPGRVMEDLNNDGWGDTQSDEAGCKIFVEEEEETQPLACTLVASPNPTDGNATTLTWTSENGTYASLHPSNSDSYFADVETNGSWYIAGITDSRDYSVTVWNDADESITCDVSVEVTEEEVVEEEVEETQALSCEIVADPSTIAAGEGTTLVWSSEGDVVSAYLAPTGSDSSFATVTADGSWYIAGITNSRSYSLIVEDADGEKYTCDAPIVVAETIADAS